MNVTVIGTGFVGVVSAGVFAKLGNQVYGLDIDKNKIESLRQGIVPFYEPGLEDLVKNELASKRLQYTDDYELAIKDADVIIIAVGTPSAANGQADLTYVLAAAKSLAVYLKPNAIVAVKSTVPPGTNNKVASVIAENTKASFFMASLPEFLKEGSAVNDALNPDRVLIGTDNADVAKKLLELHRPLPGEKIVIKAESAQMAKYSANAYLAQRITFINQIANLCEKNGADIMEVIKAIGQDKRIGSHYWYPGLGYGGSCFPKDVKELAAYAKSVGENDSLFIKIDELNEKRLIILLDNFGREVNGWQDKTVAVLGLSFKPNTNDTREAPSLKIIPYLHEQKAQINGYDPKAGDIIKTQFEYLNLFNTPFEATKDADVVMVVIEWPELITLDLQKLAAGMRGKYLIDTRNQYDPEDVTKAGLIYLGVGR
jgi:UDPglucose 6-dehydrogenase